MRPQTARRGAGAAPAGSIRPSGFESLRVHWLEFESLGDVYFGMHAYIYIYIDAYVGKHIYSVHTYMLPYVHMYVHCTYIHTYILRIVAHTCLQAGRLVDACTPNYMRQVPKVTQAF